jgi:hypothetical protein
MRICPKKAQVAKLEAFLGHPHNPEANGKARIYMNSVTRSDLIATARRIGAVLEDAIALSNTGIIEFSSHQEGLILGAWNRVRRDNPHLVRYVRAANLERLPNLPGRRFLVIRLKGGVSHG